MEQQERDTYGKEETEEERKQRLSRPVRLPRITAPSKCQENISTETWGTSFIRKRPPLDYNATNKERKRNQWYFQNIQLQQQEQPEHVAPEDKPKKVEWMSGSLVSVAFAVAALVAIVVVMKWSTSSSSSSSIPIAPQ